VLLVAGALLALLPPLDGLPVAAYAAVAALLGGGAVLVPAVVHVLLAAWPRPAGALPLLALRRARWQRHTATAAVAGVVASVALSAALTVMVGSFRAGVAKWLDDVLPADLYARTAGSAGAAEQAWLEPEFVQRAAAIPGVRRVDAGRTRSLQLALGAPAVVLIARAGVPDVLPLVQPALPSVPGETGVFVSEALAALHGVAPGAQLALPLDGRRLNVRVLGVWRDYARQTGTIAIELDTYRALSGDMRVTDLALWLAPDAPIADVQQALRAAAPDPALIDFASSAELRRLSLAIFDRSFAVTLVLQAVAITIGLVGVATALSAQTLARRKEFGLLVHLGLRRCEVVAVAAGEAAAWLAAGVVLGLALGLAIAVVLVHVVNPQSFHWTMDLVVPVARLALLAAAVWAAGTATAAWAARAAAARPAVQSVKEDW
jgi:putative ABC transport system permease protein